DGKIFMCNYSAYAAVAGINVTEEDEYYDLKKYDDSKAKELIEFRLGYSKKGYVSFCKKCRGFSSKNQLVARAAKQVEK
nr:radical SAM protein [Lachnospiraceae bacterium]